MKYFPGPGAILLRCFLLSAGLSTMLQAAPAKLKVLIVDGQNNHAWAATAPVLKRILEAAGIFTVDISTTLSGLTLWDLGRRPPVPPSVPDR